VLLGYEACQSGENVPNHFPAGSRILKWCGPCQAYTPSLVNLYNKIKPGNPKFEPVFISSDHDDGSMEEYMKDKKMPWPALKLSAVEKFRREFDDAVRGIPSVVVYDLEGKIVVKTNGTAELEKLLTE
jgi:nucleoredoxin